MIFSKPASDRETVQCGRPEKVGDGGTACEAQHVIFCKAQQNFGAAGVAAEDHADMLRLHSHWRGDVRMRVICFQREILETEGENILHGRIQPHAR